MKTAIYTRVSTDSQAEKGYSIEAQQDKLRAYCALNDMSDCEEYVDAGYSASTLERPAMQRLLQDIELGLIHTVVVYKLDRLSRKTKDTLYLVEDIFIKNNIKFISLSESIDTSTSSGKFFLSILSSVAQLERENIKERSVLGRKKKAENGYKERSPKILIGYDYDDKQKQYLINEYEAMQVRLIYKKYLEETSIADILKFLTSNYTTKYGQWKSLRQVQNILDNETYIGKFIHSKKYYDGKNIPSIIDEEVFNKVKAIREYKKSNYTRHTSAYLLTGIIFCGECGARLRGLPRYDKSATYYVCYGRDKTHKHMAKSNIKCILPYLRYESLNIQIEDSLKLIADDKKNYEIVKKQNTIKQDDIDTLNKEIKKLEAKANKTIDLLIESEISKDIFLEKLAEINKQKESLEQNLLALKKKAAEPALIYDDVKQLIQTYKTAEMPEKRLILRKLIGSITIFKDKTIKIDWNF